MKRERERVQKNPGDTDTESPNNPKQGPPKAVCSGRRILFQRTITKDYNKSINLYRANYPDETLELMSRLMNNELSLNDIQTEVEFLQDHINLLTSHLKNPTEDNQDTALIQEFLSKFEETMQTTNSLRLSLRLKDVNDNLSLVELKELRRLCTLWISYFNYDMLAFVSLLKGINNPFITNTLTRELSYHLHFLGQINEFKNKTKKSFPANTFEQNEENNKFEESITTATNAVSSAFHIISSLTEEMRNNEALIDNTTQLLENISILFDLNAVVSTIEDLTDLYEEYHNNPPEPESLDVIATKLSYLEELISEMETYANTLEAFLAHMSTLNFNKDHAYLFENLHENLIDILGYLSSLKVIKSNLEEIQNNGVNCDGMIP